MKNVFKNFTFVAILVSVFVISSCTTAPKSDEAEVGETQEVDEEVQAEAKKLDLNLETSLVTWVGTKPIGRHNGSFNLSEGFINLKEGEIVGGEYIIDINTLKVLDGDAESQKKLGTHLLSPEFFNAEKNPTAKFVITGVEPYEESEEDKATREKEDAEYVLQNPTHKVSGNFTMNGVENGITFPAKIEIDGEAVKAEAKFNINRKDWKMSYGADESLGDNFIRPTVHIGFDIATK